MSIKTPLLWVVLFTTFATGMIIGWVSGSELEAERCRTGLIGINRQLDELLEYVLTDSLFASPDGVGDECTKPQPCSYETAMKKAQDGQVIFFASGTYPDMPEDEGKKHAH